ncbi:MAG: DUF1513 domain-containing protein [Bdellovibrionales bacterium]|nr:DUF1513 domain-containing protein [Bdellovibrionales bacterium]
MERHSKKTRRAWLEQGLRLVPTPFLLSSCTSLLTKPSSHLEYQSILLASRPTKNKNIRQPILMVASSLTGHRKEFLLPSLQNPHATILSNRDPKSVVVVPNGERKSYRVSIESGQVMQEYMSNNPYGFYGHGVESPDGQYLFLSEPGPTEKSGRVAIYDNITGKFLDHLEGHGVHPHEIQVVDQGKVFILSNNGYKKSEKEYQRSFSSLSYIEVSSGKLLDQVFLPETHLHMTHLAVADNGDVAIGMDMSTHPLKQRIPSKSVVAFRKAGASIRILNADGPTKEMLGRHVLSVAYDEQNFIIGATNQYPNGPLTFWSSKKERFLRSLPIEGSSGINYLRDRRRFLVTTHNSGLYEISSPDLEVVRHIPMNDMELYVDNHSSVLI